MNSLFSGFAFFMKGGRCFLFSALCWAIEFAPNASLIFSVLFLALTQKALTKSCERKKHASPMKVYTVVPAKFELVVCRRFVRNMQLRVLQIFLHCADGKGFLIYSKCVGLRRTKANSNHCTIETHSRPAVLTSQHPIRIGNLVWGFWVEDSLQRVQLRKKDECFQLMIDEYKHTPKYTYRHIPTLSTYPGGQRGKEQCLPFGPVHTGCVSRFACKPFDAACNLCEHSHWQQSVPKFACACCEVLCVLCELGLTVQLCTAATAASLTLKKQLLSALASLF